MAHRIMNKDLKAAKHPTFEVYTKRGYLKPHLKRAFLEQCELHEFDWILNHIKIKDGSEWEVITEAEVEQYFVTHPENCKPLKCILSCQEDWQGRRVAVARIYKDKNHGTNIS